MHKHKKLLVLPLLLLAGLTLSACIGGDDTTETVETESDTRVRVINDDEDPIEEDVVLEEETDLSEDVVIEDLDDELEEDIEEEETEPIDSTVDAAGLKTLDGGSASEGVALHSYGYTVVGGKFLFGWGIGSSGTVYPKVTAGYNSAGDLVVTFPSLASDNLIGNLDNPMTLGSSLPTMEQSRSGDTSTYIFKTSSEGDFDLSIDEGEKQVVLSVTL